MGPTDFCDAYYRENQSYVQLGYLSSVSNRDGLPFMSV